MRPFAALALASALSSGCAVRHLEPVAFTTGADGFHTTSWWVDTGSEVVVFDAQFTPALAEQVIADIRARTDSPITTLVITHPNPDKYNGATAFQAAGAEVVASAETAAAMPGVDAYKEAYFVGAGMFTEETWPTLVQVDRTFEQRLELEGTGITLEVLEHGGVTGTQTVALLPGGGVVVGDLVAARTHAWLEGDVSTGAPTPDLDQWRAALDELRARVGDDAVVYPGRGPALPAGEVLVEQGLYLEQAEALVRAELAAVEDPAAELSGPDAGARYAAITAAFEGAYPEYAHSYLVIYGVYGLALQVAAE